MNADLKNALLEVQAYFLEASVNENVVEFMTPNLTTNDIINLLHIHRKNPKIKPWIFRSDKDVKVVLFITDGKGKYLVSDGTYVDSDMFETSLTDPENQPNQWGFGNELPPLIPDNVNTREEWIEYILTIHQIKMSEVVAMNTVIIDSPSNPETDLNLNIEKIIESELSSRQWSVSVDSIRKLSEKITQYVKDK